MSTMTVAKILALFVVLALILYLGRIKDLKEKIRDAVIILLISLFGFLVLGEFYVRTFKKEPPALIVASENPQLVFELNKNYPGINAFGMRDQAFAAADIRGHYKIAVIGDSHVYSIKVDNPADTFPAKIEEHLVRVPGREPVKVLNFGVPGYNMAQELELLRSKVLAFEPQLVVLQYTLNDTHVCNYLQPQHRTLNSLVHKSKLLVKILERILYSSFGRERLYDWMGDKFPDALLYQEGLVGTRKAADSEEPSHKRHPPRTKDRVPARYHYMLGEENWKKNVESFARLCREKNIPVLATGFITKKEEAVFREAGFAVYSFYDIFNGRDMKDYGYNPDNTADHFDLKGSDFIGEELAKYIQGRYFPTKP